MIVIDLESRSRADIRKAGAHHYAVHDSTEILCVAWRDLDGGPVEVWRRGDPLPTFDDDVVFVAHNAQFEAVMFEQCWGWSFDPSRWIDTAAMAAAAGIPRHLDGATKTLGLEHVKSDAGVDLIKALCMPQRDGEFKEDDALYEALVDYCVADVQAEADLYHALPDLTATEQAVWQLDASINRRGIPIDTASVEAAVDIAAQAVAKLNEEVAEITGGVLTNMNRRAAVMDYFADKGHPLKGYDKTTLRCAAATMPPDLKRLIEIRQQTGLTSIAKYSTLATVMSGADRLHGSLMYYGAATGRWSGRLFQPQNLPRPTIKHSDVAVDLYQYRDPQLLELYGDPLQVLSSGIRSVIKAPQGCRLIVADFAQIEARVLPWLAGQDDVLDVFRSGQDVYKHAAGQIYNCKPDRVDDEQRFVGKVATLALGFSGGAKAFAGMASVYGVDIDEDRSDEIKMAWRRKNDKIVAFWRDCEDAFKLAVENPGDLHRAGPCVFRYTDPWLFIQLPSGRRLSYYRPVIKPGDRGEIQFMGQDSRTRSYSTLTTYGGRITENLTQAVARDVLAEAMLRLETAGYDIVLTVHDEVIAEVGLDRCDVEAFLNIMCDLPEWADGLPVDADGFSTVRYKK